MDVNRNGTTTITITVGPISKTQPRGGSYNRLMSLMQYRRETWNDVLSRVLDYYEDNHR